MFTCSRSDVIAQLKLFKLPTSLTKAMHRFMSSAASSSSGRAERRATVSSSSSSAEQPAISLRSAERPATPSHLKILSIRDVQRWLAEEPIASCSSADAQRIREAVGVLSHPKPRKEDVRPLQSKWQVAQKKDKKPRPLVEVLHEFQGKVIKAAKKLQLELSDSAEQPASSTVEQSAPMDTADGVDLDEEPFLAELRVRQRKRAQASAAEERREAEEQRPRAKPKAAKRQNKRTAGTTSDNVEQPASKRQDRCLTAELFAACARDPSEPGAASSGSAVQPDPMQQQSQRMCRLLHELKKLEENGWVVDDAKIELQGMIQQVTDLRSIPARQDVLRKQSIRVLYTSICGALTPNHLEEQDRTHVSLVACHALEEKVLQFVQAKEEIEEANKELYALLWELRSRPHDAVLNGLPDMPRSPHELIQALKDLSLIHI